MATLNTHKYYFLTWLEEDDSLIAKAPKGTPLAHELSHIMQNVEKLPFNLTVDYDKEAPLKDFIGNSLAWPIMSEKMKELIVRSLTGNEKVTWLSININYGINIYTYYVPRFEEKLDVLDYDKTLFVKGTDHIIKPYFSLAKVSKFKIFPKPSKFWRISSALYVDEQIKKSLEDEKITGVDFENIMVG